MTNKPQVHFIKFILVIVAVAMLLCCAGCAYFANLSSKKDESAKSDAMSLYYLNKNGTTIVPVAYVPTSESTMDVVDEMLVRLSEQPDSNNYQPSIAGFYVCDSSLKDGLLTIDLSEEYKTLDKTKEILVRASIVNTVCQVTGVTNVCFTVTNEPLTDSLGKPVGNMTADMFIFNAGKEINTYEKVRLHLFFANETGDQLVDTYRTVVYNSNIAMEKLVVEEMIKGPNSDAIYPTINPETKLISVSTRDGVCYVNLDSAFLTEPYQVKPEVAIYSLVNALTTLPSVHKVQISINGDTTVQFLETMHLSTVYEHNLSVVQTAPTSN